MYYTCICREHKKLGSSLYVIRGSNLLRMILLCNSTLQSSVILPQKCFVKARCLRVLALMLHISSH